MADWSEIVSKEKQQLELDCFETASHASFVSTSSSAFSQKSSSSVLRRKKKRRRPSEWPFSQEFERQKKRSKMYKKRKQLELKQLDMELVKKYLGDNRIAVVALQRLDNLRIVKKESEVVSVDNEMPKFSNEDKAEEENIDEVLPKPVPATEDEESSPKVNYKIPEIPRKRGRPSRKLSLPPSFENMTEVNANGPVHINGVVCNETLCLSDPAGKSDKNQEDSLLINETDALMNSDQLVNNKDDKLALNGLEFPTKEESSNESEDNFLGDAKRPRKRRKLSSKRSNSESQLKKHDAIMKNLYVRLTKIDSVPKDENSINIVQNNLFNNTEEMHAGLISEKLYNYEIKSNLVDLNTTTSYPPIKTVIKLNKKETAANAIVPRGPTIDKAEADETQRMQLVMVMNAPIPNEKNTFNTEIPTELSEFGYQQESQNFTQLIDDSLDRNSLYLNEYTNRTGLQYSTLTKDYESVDDKFICSKCTQVIDMIGQLEVSVGMTEEDKGEIKCPHCSNTFQSFSYLEYHITQEHLKCENEKRCRHSRFNTYTIPNSEVTSESESYIKLSLKCKSCYVFFNSAQALNDHVILEHKSLIRNNKINGLKNFDSVTLGKTIISSSNCDKGQLLNKQEKIEAAGYPVYTCTVCSSIFQMKDEVFDHLLRVHEVSCKFPCSSCLTNYQTAELQERHNCLGDKYCNLDTLLRVAIMPSNVENNLLGHNNFLDVGAKEKHVELSSCTNDNCNSIKTIETPINGFKMRKNGVIEHSEPKKTSLKRTEHCKLCSKKFVYHSKLIHHMRKAHSVVINGSIHLNGQKNEFKDFVEEKNQIMDSDEQENWEKLSEDHTVPDKEKTIICSKCGISLKPVVNLLRHTNYVNSDGTNYFLCSSCEPNINRKNYSKVSNVSECNQCGKNFSSSSEFEDHLKTNHINLNDELYTCEYCRQSFKGLRCLEKHTRCQHNGMKPSAFEIRKQISHETDRRTRRTSRLDSGNKQDSDSNVSDGTTKQRRHRKTSTHDKTSLQCTICTCICTSNVSLSNHLNREHKMDTSICQICNELLLEITQVRHLLDRHIMPSNTKRPKNKTNIYEDVKELVNRLGKQRLQSLLTYHDFRGKCSEIMKCPGCNQSFGTPFACRHHYLCTHDKHCLLCDESFRTGELAYKHKNESHHPIASYIWFVQELLIALIKAFKLKDDISSYVLYQTLANIIDSERSGEIDKNTVESQSMLLQCSESNRQETEQFLEEVLREDQLPDPGIEIVIGKDDSEEDLLCVLNLSPNYHNVDQGRIADAVPPEPEEEQIVNQQESVTGTYVPSGVYRYKLENDEENLVLVVTDEDTITYRNNISSLANIMSLNCDSLPIEEITEMLKAYFQNL